jgi:hypothetical protein
VTGRHRAPEPDPYAELRDQVAVDTAAFLAAGWDIGDVIALVLDARLAKVRDAFTSGFLAGGLVSDDG